MSTCPCRIDSALLKAYSECCGKFLTENNTPSTPQELMRSRYTAYTQANIDYISRTMKGNAIANFNFASVQDWAKTVEWLRLVVVNEKIEESTGYVEFMVYFKDAGKKYVMHEVSEFKLENNQWYYIDGKCPSKNQTGRNDNCPCGSNLKYKKCCGV